VISKPEVAGVGDQEVFANTSSLQTLETSSVCKKFLVDRDRLRFSNGGSEFHEQRATCLWKFARCTYRCPEKSDANATETPSSSTYPWL
jgi:hypothetical protein